MNARAKVKDDVEFLRNELESYKTKLAEQTHIFENILESTLAGYWDWQIQENREYLSPTFKSMLGYEDHEMENTPEAWQKLVFQEDLPYIFQRFEEHVASKGEYPFLTEARYRHKNGATVWVFCRGRVIEWDEDGKPIRMVGCHIDITRVKKAKELEDYAKKLEHKNHELEQFAYVASHDLQEPIRTILSFVELLNKEYRTSLDENGESYLKFITKASYRMRELVKDLLDYSRIGREKTTKVLNCNRVVHSVIRDLGRVIKDNDAKIEFEELPIIKGYDVEIHRLFLNLITNSIKFRKKDVTPVIKIAVEEQQDFWKFSVKDNGIGFNDTYKEQIFIIFQRLHSRREYEGTGIGLAHCRKIIELHGGEIWAESKVDEGSTFHFTIKKIDNHESYTP